jgi:tetratricopeptide (TPR) repeat protein
VESVKMDILKNQQPDMLARRAKQAIGRMLCGCLFAAVLTGAAQAQTDHADRSAQDAAFARMYNAPNDPQAILDYAKASIALRDFEAATAALERLVAREPANYAARQQLALAYYALGSNAMADVQWQILAQASAVDPVLAAQAQVYQQQAATRRAPSALSGNLRVGTAQTTQAGSQITTADLALVWRQDLGSARGNQWLTSLRVLQGWPSDAADADAYSATIKSGVTFALGTARSSARVEPFVLLSEQRNAANQIVQRLGAGLSLTLAVTEQAVVVAQASAGRLQASNSTMEGRYTNLSVLGVYQVDDRMSLRARYDRDARRALSFADETTTTGTLELWHEFRPAFSNVDRNWRLIPSLRQTTIATSVGDFETQAAGILLRGWITDTSFADLGVTELRDTSNTGAVTQQTGLSLRIGVEF